MKRVFIAVDVVPSSKLKEDYQLVQYRMRLERINWVHVEHMHITLSFLGDTEERILPDIITMLWNITAGQNKYEITLRSLGVFKNLSDPRVIWIGCDPCMAMEETRKKIDYGISQYGFEIESRTFSPHLTLGRIKEIRQQNQLAQLITLYKEVVFQKQLIENIVLYESKLTAKGSEYIPLQIFSLQSSF